VNVKRDRSPVVEILLSTYNGEKYLKEQIDSLFAQTHKEWRLIVRDDGSTDSTVEVVKGYQSLHPGKVILVEDTEGRLGPTGSFSRLLENSTADYLMFCDQDDVWLPEKMETTLARLRTLESGFETMPLLVHTDLKVTDEGLNVIADSFLKYQNLDPGRKDLNNLLVFNNVTGCTVMMNRALKDLATPIPAEAVIHDWWMALVASAFGIIEYMNVPTVLYRQHAENVVGSTGYSIRYFASRLKTIGSTAGLIRRMVRQASALDDLYGERLSREKRLTVRTFSTLLKRRRPGRLYTLYRYKFRGTGFFWNLGVFTLWLFMSGEDGVRTYGTFKKDNA